MLTTEGTFHPNIYIPGKILVRCTLPQENINPCPWLLHLEVGKMFEAVIAETGPSDACMEHAVMASIRYGVNNDIVKSSRKKILMKNTDQEFHTVGITWDGMGNWYWTLDGIYIMQQRIRQPLGLNPCLALSLEVTRPLKVTRIWKVQWIKYQKG
jgi:hypothetical protein